MRRETRRESFNVELPEMEKVWLLREERKKRKIAWKILLCILVASLVAGFVTAVVKTVERHHDHKQPPPPAVNYTLALHKALSFFEAQRSGKLPDGNKVSWRGDSCLQDGNYPGSDYTDLVGGYYDGGDATKSSFPMSFSMTMLSWSVIEYSAKYQAAGELNHVKELIKWGTDYFIKTFDSSADAITQIVVQIGSPNDHYCWMRPEDIDYQRRSTQCFVGCPDVAAEMAASLASASIVFKDDMEYSHKLLRGAKLLYKFAESDEDRKTDSSKFDELIWGATWMYYASGDVTYLDRATSHTLADRAGSSYVFSWDKKLVGAQLLLTRLRLFLGPGYPYEEVLSIFHAQISRVMCSYLPYFTTFNRTKGGLIQLNHGDPQPLQYAANAAFLAKLYSDYLEESLIPGWYCGHTLYRTQVLRDFSTSQVDYILGNNPRNMSYVVGYGEQYPKHIHHRGASIPPNQKESCKGGWKWRDTQDENPNTIDGAMVAGPDKEDGFRDLRADYNYTEPSLAGNAGLVAALLALSEASGGIDKNTMFSVVPPLYPATPPPPAPWTP